MPLTWRTIPDSEPNTALSVTPLAEDHTSLQLILSPALWRVYKARDVRSAIPLLRHHQMDVVFCERDLIPGGWSELLEVLKGMANPPSLIVTSRLADEQLWSEVLNRGGWDVLAKPFGRGEVLRSIRSAWQHRPNSMKAPAGRVRVLKAAS